MVEVQQIGQPDCMISVDVSKAYDRLRVCYIYLWFRGLLLVIPVAAAGE